jgi:hypothetical protein
MYLIDLDLQLLMGEIAHRDLLIRELRFFSFD